MIDSDMKGLWSVFLAKLGRLFLILLFDLGMGVWSKDGRKMVVIMIRLEVVLRVRVRMVL